MRRRQERAEERVPRRALERRGPFAGRLAWGLDLLGPSVAAGTVS